ncbi:MAG: ribonuclease H family protein [Saprospiraceae bacterium]
MAKSKKYYTVWHGHKTGVFDNWAECLLQTKNFPNAKYKSFKTSVEAVIALNEGYEKHIGTGAKSKKATIKRMPSNIIKNSIAVDAACSGNPGLMEYQGVVTTTKELLFHQGPFEQGTNNIGEFLALVHALAMLKKQNNTAAIYTDSRTAMAWVRNRKVKTTLQKTNKNSILFDMIERAIKWLIENNYRNQIIKWDTKNWGEIPADFGRK